MLSSPWERKSSAHIIGVVVSETTSDTAMATESVTANSRNRRPTMPPIRRIGMKTAISETLMETTVKPISLAPWSAACNGAMPRSRWRVMFSIDHDRIVDDETGGDGQRHERQIVDAVAEQVHHAERADQ